MAAVGCSPVHGTGPDLTFIDALSGEVRDTRVKELVPGEPDRFAAADQVGSANMGCHVGVLNRANAEGPVTIIVPQIPKDQFLVLATGTDAEHAAAEVPLC